MSISEIERHFNSQKERLLKQLEHLEKEKRSRYEIVVKELDRYKRRENDARRVEAVTSNHLRQLTHTLEALRRQENSDKRRIAELTREITRLTNEVPRLASTSRRLSPEQRNVERREDKYSRKLSQISARVREVESRRNIIRKELSDVTKREQLLRQGRIYWPANTSVADTRRLVAIKEKQAKMREKMERIRQARLQSSLQARERRLETIRARRHAAFEARVRSSSRAKARSGDRRSFLERLLISK